MWLSPYLAPPVSMSRETNWSLDHLWQKPGQGNVPAQVPLPHHLPMLPMELVSAIHAAPVVVQRLEMGAASWGLDGSSKPRQATTRKLLLTGTPRATLWKISQRACRKPLILLVPVTNDYVWNVSHTAGVHVVAFAVGGSLKTWGRQLVLSLMEIFPKTLPANRPLPRKHCQEKNANGASAVTLTWN